MIIFDNTPKSVTGYTQRKSTKTDCVAEKFKKAFQGAQYIKTSGNFLTSFYKIPKGCTDISIVNGFLMYGIPVLVFIKEGEYLQSILNDTIDLTTSESTTNPDNIAIGLNSSVSKPKYITLNVSIPEGYNYIAVSSRYDYNIVPTVYFGFGNK